MDIDELKNAMEEKGHKSNAPATEEEIKAFEEKHGIELPSEYREYLLKIGNGGDGPPDFGIVPLGFVPEDVGMMSKKAWTALVRIKEPFPFDGHTEMEWTDDNIDELWDQCISGNILLGAGHWNVVWHLIITGSKRGEVWMSGEDDWYPDAKSFSEWLDAWLKK